MDNQKIGAFISARRKEKGLTQAQLAEQLGVTNKAVSKWESGNGLPDISLFPVLSELLGVTADELFRGERTAPPRRESDTPEASAAGLVEGEETPEEAGATRAFELPESAPPAAGPEAPVLPARRKSRLRAVPVWAWAAGAVALTAVLAAAVWRLWPRLPVSGGPAEPSAASATQQPTEASFLPTTTAETTVQTTMTTTTTPAATTTTTAATTTAPRLPALPGGVSADTLTASAVLLYDNTAGQNLYAYEDSAQRDPASLTKLMTAIVALQYADPDSAHYVVGSEQDLVQKPESSLAYLEQGWDMPLKALLHAMLLPSGCDAAYTVAVGVGRDVGGAGLSDREAVQVFCGLMNQKAQELGAVDTQFVNPDGFRQGNRSTARDLLLIARYAMQQPLIRETASRITIRDTFPNADGGTEDVTWDRNTNLLLDPTGPAYFNGATGLKTGSSDTAGYCVVASASRNGRELIAVVLGSRSDESRWRDVSLVLEAGFAA